MAKNQSGSGEYTPKFMPDDMKFPEEDQLLDLTNEQWAALNDLVKRKDPKLGHVIQNADMFLETIIDHNKVLRDVATGGLDKIKPALAAHLRAKFPHEIPAVQRQTF